MSGTPPPFSEPAETNDFLADHVALMRASLLHWCGCDLVEEPDPALAARLLYFAPFALLSHDAAGDPRFNYANRKAQALFGMDWEAFCGTPSRLSAEPSRREERARLLARVSRQGFTDDYSGVRVARGGRRFRIEHATVWNLVGVDGRHCGQAAMFSVWRPL